MALQHAFVGLPADYGEVFLHDQAGARVRQVLWGDWLWIDDAQPDTDPTWRHVVWSPNDPAKRQSLKIRRAHTTDSRPLEIVFVDVGQGDGCVLITPERDENERIIVIDAGEGPEMGEFLKGRFGGYNKRIRFHAAVVTHPDEDHYYGFKSVFESGAISFDHLYHSTIVDRPSGDEWARIGRSAGSDVIDRLVETDAQMRQIFGGPPSARHYAEIIQTAIAKQVVADFQPLSTVHGTAENGRSWMPGFAPSDPRDYDIEVLGPLVETGANGKRQLRRFGDPGKTKNGHSVILRLTYKGFRVLFGGDLNLPAEQFLLTHYAGLTAWPKDKAGRDAMVQAARTRLRCEAMKVCHHGASDVTDEFMQAVDPACFVISSGDEEGHVHPRPDLLGRLGRKGRGDSPVLLSTELQRSTRPRESRALVDQLRKDLADQKTAWTEARDKRINAAIDILGGSNVSVDGAIYVKTDGMRLIAAFKNEINSDKKKWFYFEYRLKDGELELVRR